MPVVIVGGGASGTILAAQLAHRGICCVLIDGSGRMGRGVAYSTTEAVHLLNVRAEGMSALAGKPDHFAAAFGSQGGDRRGFAPRPFYASYLGAILDGAVASGSTELVEETVVTAHRESFGWRIGLGDGSSICAKVLVLAIGNQEPLPLSAFDGVGSRYVGNPWGADAREAVGDLAATGEPVLLVGTGLTMVDLVLSLDAAGYSGRILALSRRGLAPRGHADFEPMKVERHELPTGLSGIFRWLRRKSAEAGWRAAVDSLRPHSHSLWQELSDEEHQRFLRHVRPWWDVHRHRIAPEVADTVARMIAQGRLEIVAGRILSARRSLDGLKVEYRPRGADRSKVGSFAYAFNCTGPLHSIAKSKDPLLRSLLDRSEIRPDHLGIGLKVDETNRAGEHLWAMGPLTKGRYWEIIAVPDIREQAARVADEIERELAE